MIHGRLIFRRNNFVRLCTVDQKKKTLLFHFLSRIVYMNLGTPFRDESSSPVCLPEAHEYMPLINPALCRTKGNWSYLHISTPPENPWSHDTNGCVVSTVYSRLNLLSPSAAIWILFHECYPKLSRQNI